MKNNILIMILLSIVLPILAIFMVYVLVTMIQIASSMFMYWFILAMVCSVTTILIFTVNRSKFIRKGILFYFGLVLIASGIILLIG